FGGSVSPPASRSSFMYTAFCWSKECMQNWGSFIHLAIPGMVMLCVEWWTYEIGAFLAGLISEVELGAQSVVYQLANIAYMFPMGFSVAGSVRVGNALGAGETEQAKLSAKMSMFLSICLAVLIASLKGHISYIFTYDEIIGVFGNGIIQGAGKQRVGAICNTLGYYGIGFPIGVPLMFAAKLGIKGKIHSRDVLFSSSHGQTDNMDLVEAEEEPTVKEELNHRTLVLRRGLALAAMLFILAAGIIINLLITNLVT
uniref:Solute carrier family 47 member 3 n=1 Tax=Seriola lalandi dorsalis TaxID=1841481 RepID=A0A3B4XEK5_SERLL